MWASLMGGKKKPPTRTKVSPTVAEAFGPPLSEAEQNGNLSQIERTFNSTMKCPAGRNQVFIRSLLTGKGTTQPRIALKCTYRRDIGQEPVVFHDHIAQFCCGDPNQCPAYQEFRKRAANL